MGTSVSTTAAVKAILQESNGETDETVKSGLYGLIAFAIEEGMDRLTFLDLAAAHFDFVVAEAGAEEDCPMATSYAVTGKNFVDALTKLVKQYRELSPSIQMFELELEDGSTVTIRFAAPRGDA